MENFAFSCLHYRIPAQHKCGITLSRHTTLCSFFGGQHSTGRSCSWAASCVAAIAQPLAAMFSDRIGRRLLLIVGAVLSLLSYLLYLVSPGIRALMMVRLLHGFATAIFFPEIMMAPRWRRACPPSDPMSSIHRGCRKAGIGARKRNLTLQRYTSGESVLRRHL